MEFIIPALAIGLLGSFHCIGMCGPIALALPLPGASPAGRTLAIVIYNLGRMLTYSAFGLVFGLFGKLFFMAGLQQVLSVVIGTLILLYLFLPARSFPGRKLSGGLFSAVARLRNSLSHLFARRSRSTLFLVGLLNGLLPCGLVYAAVAGAVSTGSGIKGAVFMALFGLGTVPVMLALPLLKNRISLSFRGAVRKSYPYLVSCMAVLLILRGFNLGIPCISPEINKEQGLSGCCAIAKKPAPGCCHKNKHEPF